MFFIHIYKLLSCLLYYILYIYIFYYINVIYKFLHIIINEIKYIRNYKEIKKKVPFI